MNVCIHSLYPHMCFGGSTREKPMEGSWGLRPPSWRRWHVIRALQNEHQELDTKGGWRVPEGTM